ncbi:MAG: lipopolysaccharide kinase InaA family protein [Planctomycetaceae bacterium]
MFQRRALAEELGELIARLHSRGVVHRDLHGGNILLRPAAGGFRLWLVDLAPLRFLRECPAEAVLAQNLGRLRATRSWNN